MTEENTFEITVDLPAEISVGAQAATTSTAAAPALQHQETVPFFVYGSMTEGLVHFEKIKEFVVNSRSARARGRAYRLQVGFPVFVDNGMDLVPGALLDLKANSLLINILDEFHGVSFDEPQKSLYFRKQVEVEVDGQTQTAWSYTLNPAKLPKTATLIDGGDWMSSLKNEPALTEKLTERQRHYICRLGAISGREIVPINDLSLYRELMNLELIVDKGRRLALSKLGHEVHRYLE
jgi:gamma-glutamylcyclotransferase (GGCT)/AIG2-like uncharacterized protein YtfP